MGFSAFDVALGLAKPKRQTGLLTAVSDVGNDYTALSSFEMGDQGIDNIQIQADPAVESANVMGGLAEAHQYIRTDPVSVEPSQMFGAVGIGMQIGKAIGQVYGAYAQHKANQSMYKAEASMAAADAQLAQIGVEQAFRAGEAQIAKVTMYAAEVKAKQRAAYAKNGVAIGTGSSAEALASTDLGKEVDKLTIQQNALAQAWGYRRKKMMSEAKAEAYKKLSKSSGNAWIGTSLASLASTAASAYTGGAKIGLFGGK